MTAKEPFNFSFEKNLKEEMFFLSHFLLEIASSPSLDSFSNPSCFPQVCDWVFVYGCVHVRVCLCLYGYVCIWVCVHMGVCAHEFVYESMCEMRACVRVWVGVCMGVHVWEHLTVRLRDTLYEWEMEFVQVCELVLQRLFRWNQHICVAIRERERERGTEREILFEGETHNSFLSFRKNSHMFPLNNPV